MRCYVNRLFRTPWKTAAMTVLGFLLVVHSSSAAMTPAKGSPTSEVQVSTPATTNITTTPTTVPTPATTNIPSTTSPATTSASTPDIPTTVQSTTTETSVSTPATTPDISHNTHTTSTPTTIPATPSNVPTTTTLTKTSATTTNINSTNTPTTTPTTTSNISSTSTEAIISATTTDLYTTATPATTPVTTNIIPTSTSALATITSKHTTTSPVPTPNIASDIHTTTSPTPTPTTTTTTEIHTTTSSKQTPTTTTITEIYTTTLPKPNSSQSTSTNIHTTASSTPNLTPTTSTDIHTTALLTQTSSPNTSSDKNTSTSPTSTPIPTTSTDILKTTSPTPTSTPTTSTDIITTAISTQTATPLTSTDILTTTSPTPASTPTTTTEIHTAASSTPNSTPTTSTDIHTTALLTQTSSPNTSSDKNTTTSPTSTPIPTTSTDTLTTTSPTPTSNPTSSTYIHTTISPTSTPIPTTSTDKTATSSTPTPTTSTDIHTTTSPTLTTTTSKDIHTTTSPTATPYRSTDIHTTTSPTATPNATLTTDIHTTTSPTHTPNSTSTTEIHTTTSPTPASTLTTTTEIHTITSPTPSQTKSTDIHTTTSPRLASTPTTTTEIDTTTSPTPASTPTTSTDIITTVISTQTATPLTSTDIHTTTSPTSLETPMTPAVTASTDIHTTTKTSPSTILTSPLTTSSSTATAQSSPSTTTELIIDCRSPKEPLNGSMFVNSTLLYGLVSYYCNPGFTRNGTDSASCMVNGNWSATAPVCMVVVCPNLTRPINGNFTYLNGSTRYRHMAEYQCNPGFSLVGFTLRVCQANGAWSGSQPNCETVKPDVKACPEDKDGRGTTWPETKPGQVHVFDCAGNNTIGQVSRNCSLGGQWKPAVYNCVKEEFAKASQKINSILDSPSEAGVETALSTLSNLTSSTEELYEGEIQEATNFLHRIANVSATNVTVTQKQTESFFSTTSNLLDKKNEGTWKAIAENSDEQAGSGAVQVLQVIDSYVGSVAHSLTDKESNRTVKRSNMELIIAKVSNNESPPDLNFPQPSENASSQSRLYLTGKSLKGSTSYSAIVYKDLTGILPTASSDSANSNEDDLNSAVLALKLLPSSSSKELADPVVLTFEHLSDSYTDQKYPKCSFWNFEKSAWNTNGCSVRNTTANTTVCVCEHLTNFAILMSPWVQTNVDTLAIDVISYVGCGLSALCLLITIIVHIALWRYVKADRVVILMNLSVALVLSYVIFLAGVNQTEQEDACTAVAVLLQYIYLVVFFLMLAEGVEIAITVLYVFPTKSRLKWILPLAWGLPVVIVGVSIGVTKFDGYGTKGFCWLSVENHLIWSFVGPALLIIVVNFLILAVVLKAMFRTKSLSESSRKNKTKVGVRCLCVLLPLMGCSWVLGIFYVDEKASWIQYVFAVCNSLQGVVIFIFHCLTNEKIKMALRSRRLKYSDSIQSAKQSKPFSLPRVSQFSTSSVFNSDSYDNRDEYPGWRDHFN